MLALCLPYCYHFNAEGAQLELFGSSKNGFGVKSSDLDLCLKDNGCSEVG